MGGDALIRPEGWEKRLKEFVDAYRFAPFVWGGNDCAGFAIAGYRAIMQCDPPNAPTWSDSKEAVALLREKSLEELTTIALGKPTDGWKMARRGDVVLIRSNIDTKFNQSLAICVGSLLAGAGKSAIAFIPLTQGLKTWRVGD